jgi:hypothetical protein
MKLKILLFSLLTSNYSFAQAKVGLIERSECSQDGVILFAPLFSTETYLIDKCGHELHRWVSSYTPGQSVYLLPSGNLLRSANDSSNYFMNRGGLIEVLDWNSRVIWSYSISDSMQRQHHDIYPMPNGNILAIVWDRVSGLEALNKGRDSAIKGKYVWSEKIIELKRLPNNKAEIVWEWRAWDHLVQEFNPSLPNYGKVSENPQLLNINYLASSDPDWLHFNSIDFNPQLNQILVSNRNFSEIFIIDHSTTKAQAASHRGGKSNKGGDLLFRWGNSATYMGTPLKNNTEEQVEESDDDETVKQQPNEQQLYSQHSANWIKPGLDDAGKIMVFNNGVARLPEKFSTVDIIHPQMDKQGNYQLDAKHTYMPEKAEWQYGVNKKKRFYSTHISSAQRLANGNTLICEGEKGRFFEIDKNRNTVWSYVNPVSYKKKLTQGDFIEKNEVFRCSLYQTSYEGLKNKVLKPGLTLELKSTPDTCYFNKLKKEPCNN